jgi:hypothetical protein
VCRVVTGGCMVGRLRAGIDWMGSERDGAGHMGLCWSCQAARVAAAACRLLDAGRREARTCHTTMV